MPSKKNELVKLENQRIILKTYSEWIDKQKKLYDSFHIDCQIKLNDLRIEKADLEELENTAKFGSSMFNVIYLFLMAIFYALPTSDVFLINNSFMCLALSAVLFIFGFVRRATRLKKPFSANLFCFIVSSLSLILVTYFLAVFSGGIDFAKGIDIERICTLKVYDHLKPIYMNLSILFCASLVIISLLKKLRVKVVRKESKKELEKVKMEIENLEKEEEKSFASHKERIEKASKEYFEKHNLVLPNATLKDIENIKEILLRDDVATLSVALNIYKKTVLV